MNPLKFRLAIVKDVTTLVTINIDGAESYRAINVKMFKDLVKTKQVLCATQDGQMVGLLYFRNDFLGRFNQWYLKQITVSKKYRKQGVGLSLLKEFLVYAKKKKVEVGILKESARRREKMNGLSLDLNYNLPICLKYQIVFTELALKP